MRGKNTKKATRAGCFLRFGRNDSIWCCILLGNLPKGFHRAVGYAYAIAFSQKSAGAHILSLKKKRRGTFMNPPKNPLHLLSALRRRPQALRVATATPTFGARWRFIRRARAFSCGRPWSGSRGKTINASNRFSLSTFMRAQLARATRRTPLRTRARTSTRTGARTRTTRAICRRSSARAGSPSRSF